MPEPKYVVVGHLPSGDLFVCCECGATVYVRAFHTAWHAALMWVDADA